MYIYHLFLTARRWMIRFESRCMSLPNLGAVIVNARMVKTKRLPLATLVLFLFMFAGMGMIKWEWLGYWVFFGKELRVMSTRVVIRVDMPLSSGNVGDPPKVLSYPYEMVLAHDSGQRDDALGFRETLLCIGFGNKCSCWSWITHWNFRPVVHLQNA